ncbi:hypothetical protein GCM10027294_40310 [Marinactinospora endophytica]
MLDSTGGAGVAVAARYGHGPVSAHRGPSGRHGVPDRRRHRAQSAFDHRGRKNVPSSTASGRDDSAVLFDTDVHVEIKALGFCQRMIAARHETDRGRREQMGGLVEAVGRSAPKALARTITPGRTPR